MKSLKITLVTIFSLAFFTAVNTSAETNSTPESTNHEINKPKVKLTAFTERKKETNPPTNG